LQVLADEHLDPPARLRIETRLKQWLAQHIRGTLKPLVAARDADVPAAVRGIVYQLAENGGGVLRTNVEAQLASLSEADRAILARLGVRFGRDAVFMPALMKAAPLRLRGLLWIAAHRATLGTLPELPPPGRTSVPLGPNLPQGLMVACGYRPIAGVAYRVDVLERFAGEARKLARQKVKILPPALLSLLGMSAAAAVPVLKALGFRVTLEDTALHFTPRRPPRVDKPVPTAVNPDSPFSKLRTLIAS